MWIWIAVLAGLIVLYIVSYTLLRTSGDGRGGLRRLMHPNQGGLQEEYGGDGHGQEVDVSEDPKHH